MSTESLQWLGQAAWWSAIAILVVLVLRQPFIRGFGIRAAMPLWLLVPLAMIGALLPARTVTDTGSSASVVVLQLSGAPTMRPVAAETVLPVQDLAPVVLGSWLAGVVATVLLLTCRQRRFRLALGPLHPIRGRLRRSGRALAGPLVLGLLRPVVIVPPDFWQRFDRRARRLMLAHEFTHLRRCDPFWNAFAAAMQCVFWFNPLVHWGAARFRRDQELACDACVLEGRPGERKTYAYALLALESTLGPSSALAFGHHPLKERIRMMATSSYPSAARATLGQGTTALLAVALAAAAWASNPRAGDEPIVETGSTGERFAVDVEVTVDGRTEAGSLTMEGDVAIAPYQGKPRMLAEQKLSFEHEAPESGWSADVTVERIAEDRFEIAAEISRNGELVSTPRMITAAESPAFVETADAETGQIAYRLSFTPTLIPGEADSARERTSPVGMLVLILDGDAVVRWVEWPSIDGDPLRLSFDHSGRPETWSAQLLVQRIAQEKVELCLDDVAHPKLRAAFKRHCMELDPDRLDRSYMKGELGEDGIGFRLEVLQDQAAG
ncbi:MAG: M56 family metallopeptidase [Candidatus Wenzhouxiangella sp. M2_3B_020]